jgi:hypothetical protein
MKNILSLLIIVAAIASFKPINKDEGWISLFDGKSLNGWKVGNNAATFSIEDGSIVAHGQTAHLFYDGDVMQHNFKNFELKAEVMTLPDQTPEFIFILLTRKVVGLLKAMKFR